MLERTPALVERFVEERNTPGAVVLVGYGGGGVWTISFGVYQLFL